MLSFVADGAIHPHQYRDPPDSRLGPRGPEHHRCPARPPVTVTFTIAQARTERLQQLLAQLNYLPLAFTPQGRASHPTRSSRRKPARSPGVGRINPIADGAVE